MENFFETALNLYADKHDKKSNIGTIIKCNETIQQGATPAPLRLIKDLRTKNHNRLIIGSLNINSLSGKFDQLKCIIGTDIDVLIIQETKLNDSFPENQFILPSFSKPFRLDRDKFGAGIIIYVKEHIPSQKLDKHKFGKNKEGLFVEINLRKCKLLLFGGYRSNHEVHGIKEKDFFHEITLALDKYISYDKFLLAGDFNTEASN